MPHSDPTTHYLGVPGARLYYERRGTGPLLLMIGSPMDSTGFTGLAGTLAGSYTVVTYDPRGIGNSSREDTAEDVTPEQQAELDAAANAAAAPELMAMDDGPLKQIGQRLRRNGYIEQLLKNREQVPSEA